MASVQLSSSNCLSSNLTSRTNILDNHYPRNMTMCLLMSVYKLHRSKKRENPTEKCFPALNPQSEPVHTPPCGPSIFSYTVHTSQKYKDSSHTSQRFLMCVCLCVCGCVCICLLKDDTYTCTHTHTHTHTHTYTTEEGPSNPLHYTTLRTICFHGSNHVSLS